MRSWGILERSSGMFQWWQGSDNRGMIGAMQTNLVVNANDYDYQRAEWIAYEYALGDSLKLLHESHPDKVPAPLVINRWRRNYPAFDLLMQEAEESRADVLADETINIADDDSRNAANARNGITARHWLASRLSRARYGAQQTVKQIHSGTIEHKRIDSYTDAQLQSIIRGDDIERPALEHSPTPGTPPWAERTALEAKDGEDLSTVKTTTKQPSVTTDKLRAQSGKPEKNFVKDFTGEGE